MSLDMTTSDGRDARVQPAGPTELERLLRTLAQEIAARGPHRIVLLRNYEGLPRSNPGKDIDIIAEPSAVPAWEAALAATAGSLDLRIANSARSTYFSSYDFRRPDGSLLIKIDLNFAFEWRGVTFADLSALVRRIHLHAEPVHVVSDATQRALVTFHHSFLYGGFINPKYADVFRRQIEQDDGFRADLARTLGRAAADEIVSRILSGRLAIPRSRANAIRAGAIARAVLRSPVATVIGLIRSFRSVPATTF